MKRMQPMRRVRIFTNRYPLLGPLVYVLSLQFFVVQFLVAAQWEYVPGSQTAPAYSYTANVISDLGNTACGLFGERYVCSPAHQFMNASFIALGLTMAIGSLLIYQMFKRTKLSLFAFMLMGFAGLGTALVGLYPENTVGWLHAVGAFLAIGIGNLGVLLLAIAIKDAQPTFRLYTLLTGLVSLTAFGLFVSGNHLMLGPGGMERLAAHPQTIWLILFGAYMTGVRMRSRSAKAK